MSDITSTSPKTIKLDTPTKTYTHWVWIKVLFWVYALLVAVSVIGSGFKVASGGGEATAQLFDFANNAVLGLLTGTLATALVQSSSTVTSILVGLVAGGLPVHLAIPMIMGANIGTTITNTLVSLGHIRNKEEFKRAFSASTIHDFFNWLAVLIILPLEIMTGFLEKLSLVVANMLVGGQSLSIKSLDFIKPLTSPSVKLFENIAGNIPDLRLSGFLLIVMGITLIFASVVRLGKLLRTVMVGRAKDILHNSIGRGPVSGICSGAIMTVMVQSSSTTTSLMVPMVGSGVFSVRQMYPYTLGANIGTTITALLAATAISGPAALPALTIALVHFFFNLISVLLIYGISWLRNIPLILANKLSDFVVKNRAYAFGYLVLAFFLLPALAIFIAA